MSTHHHRRTPGEALAGLAIAALLAAPASASVVEVDWAGSVLLDTAAVSSGPVNPAVLVGFNPQPEPPAFGHPPEPGFPSPDAALFRLDATGLDPVTTTFRVLLGIGNGADLAFGPVGTPDALGHLDLDVLGVTGGVVYRLGLDLTSDSGGVPAPGSLVGFNPQPEPPAIGPGGAGLGLDFGLTSLSEARLQVQVFDAAGNPFAFTGQFSRIPEPATLSLAILGLAGLSGVARRRRGPGNRHRS